MRKFPFLVLVLLMLMLAGLLTSSCTSWIKKRRPVSNADQIAIPAPQDVRAAPSAGLPGTIGGPNDNELKSIKPSPRGGDAKPENKPKTAASSRKVIYTGSITLRVANKVTGRQEIDGLVKKYDGLIVNATLDAVTFRVMPEQFEAAMNDAAQLGEVADKEVKSEDVTAQFFDLNLRLEVAEGSRQRLMEILKKTGAVKDVLEVERDIRRLTEEIETIKGMVRKMQDQIDLATITIRLEEKQLIAQPRRQSISSVFSWMNSVGLDDIQGPIPTAVGLDGEFSIVSLFRGQPYRLATGDKDQLLPAGFLPVVYNGSLLVGVTPQDNRLRVQWLELKQPGKIGFWADALSEEFKNYRGYIVRRRDDFKLGDPQLQAVAIRCETAIGSTPWAYDVWLIQHAEHPEYLYTVEYARAKKQADQNLPQIEEAVRGIHVR